jgi:hypothetical protein
MAVAAVVLVAGLAVLFGMDLRFVDRTSPDAVADYFMESWVAGDGEAAAAIFSKSGSVVGDVPGMLPEGVQPEDFPALHDWFRALDWEFEARGCGPLRYIFFSCAYRYENNLTQAVGAEPVTGSFFLTITTDGIDTITSQFGYYQAWDMFLAWASAEHPAELEVMLRPDSQSPRLDETSINLWDLYTDRFADEVATDPELLAEWLGRGEGAVEPESTSEEQSWLPDDYLAEVTRICSAADKAFQGEVSSLWAKEVWTNEDQELMHQAAALHSEEALSQLRQLPYSGTDATRLEQVLSLMEDQTQVLHLIAEAATAGQAASVETLIARRVDLTHQKDSVGGPDFWSCPVGLPA